MIIAPLRQVKSSSEGEGHRENVKVTILETKRESYRLAEGKHQWRRK